MELMVIKSFSPSRRDFLAQSGGLFLSLSALPLKVQAKSSELLISSVRSLDGQNHLVLSSLDGQLVARKEVAHRYHSMAVHPKKEHAIFVERRPGSQFQVLSLETKKFIASFSAPPDRHLYGHGAFSLNGRYLLLTMNDLKTMEGKVGVFDTFNNYQFVTEFSSGGIGPHDIQRHPKKDLFFICNGGIKTHPSTGREKLNIDSMQPNLCLFDLKQNRLSQVAEPTNSFLSLRHMAVNDRGDIIVGYQDQDFIPGESNVLIAKYSIQNGFQEILMDPELVSQAQGYVASLAMDPSSKYGLCTCPKGNLVLLWDLYSNQLIRKFSLKGASGASYSKKHHGFILSSGSGTVLYINPQKDQVVEMHQAQHQWDNHLVLV